MEPARLHRELTTIFERTKAAEANLLLSQEIASQIAARVTRSMDELTASLMPRYSWEQRLADEVARRSLRARLRRVRVRLSEYRYRIATAVDVLRDRHDCRDY